MKVITVFTLIVFFVSTYIPFLPINFDVNEVSAAVNVEPSTVDTSMPLSVSPLLNGETVWYYDGLTDVINNANGQILGQAYRYRSNNGDTRTMISPGTIGDWSDILNGNRHYVIERVTGGSLYSFQPPAPKSRFERYLISEVFLHAGASYTSSGNSIRVSLSEEPRVTKFSIKEQADENKCYPLGSEITIDLSVKEFSSIQDRFKRIEVYAEYPSSNEASIIKEFINVKGQIDQTFSTFFTFTLNRAEPVNFYIRAYDEVERLDYDSKNLKRTVGSISPVGLQIKSCAAYNVTQDSSSIPFYDYTNKTLLDVRSLENRGFVGRANDNMRSYPSGNTAWFGPIRFPTIFKGHPEDDGIELTELNSTFTAESGRSSSAQIKAYRFPFLYLSGPINPTVDGPNKMIHDSIQSTSYNIQDINQFNAVNVKTMFNGDSNYILGSQQHNVRVVGAQSSLGKYFWIRDLAERAGAEAENVDHGDNETALAIYQTDYPDIEVFETTKTNTFKPNEKLFFNFNGFEYVAPDKKGNIRTIVSWDISIVDGPDKGNLIKGYLNSSKNINNSKKPYMKRYDGKFQSSSTTSMTPTKEGVYTFELRVTDQVKRVTTSKRIAVEIKSAGGGTAIPKPDDPEKENKPPAAFVSAESFHYWPEVMNISTLATDPDGDDELIETLYVDGQNATPQWNSSRVTEKTKRNVLFTVDDGNGGTAEASTTFETWPTTPTAATTIDGTLKQNRSLVVDAKFSDKKSPVHVAPIDYSQTKWNIVPVSSGITSEDIKIRPSSDPSIQQYLFKKSGKYVVQLTVTNIYGEESEVHSRELDIVVDEEPLSRFTVDQATKLRNKDDNQKASIILTDASVSLDEDIIQQRLWYVEFDANNDGQFGTAADGGKQIISSANETKVVYKSNHVGNYRFSLEVKEAFGQPTYEEFINPLEYLRDTSDELDSTGSLEVYKNPSNFNIPHTDKSVEIVNSPPTIDFGVRRMNKLDIVLDFGGMDIATQQHQTGSRPGGGVNNGGGGGRYDHYYYSINQTDKNRLTSFAGNLQTDLLMKGIDANVTIDNCYYQQADLDGQCVRDIPVWGNVDRGYYMTSSYTGSSPYSGSWEVVSQSSTPIMAEVAVWCDNGTSSHAPPCLYEANTQYETQQVGTRYDASLRKWQSDWRFEVVNYTSSGCSYTEQVDTTDFTTDFANHSFSPSADYKYYYRMDRAQWTWRSNATKKNLVTNKIKNDDIFFWSNANNSLRLDAQNLINGTGKDGRYTQYNTNLQSNIQTLRDELLNKFMTEEDPENFTIVLGDELDYTTNYEDYESDPELQREWKFVHDPTSVNKRVIDSGPSKPIVQSGLYINQPMQLSEVGTYTVTLRAKDNPLSNTGNDTRFSDYRKWSDEEIVREYKINVHRRPIADFKSTVEAGTLKLTLDSSDSYDPDHQFNWSDLGIAENGIVEHTWEKYVLDDVEYAGKPPATLQPLKDYYITLRVKDIDGAYGTVTKLVSTKNVNLKPIALFDSPSVVLRSDSLNTPTLNTYIRDRSYDPNGDALTNYSWTIKRQSDGLTVWSSATSPTSFEAMGLPNGKYLIGLRLWDIPKYPPSLQSDLFEREITVLSNDPPNSCFELSRTTITLASITCTDGITSPHTIFVDNTAIYTDKSSDPNGHSLINYSWNIEKLDANNNVTESWNTGSAPIDFSLFGGIGKYRVTQIVFDNPPSPLPSLSGKHSRIYNVIKGPQNPYAMFDYEPLLPIAGNTITLSDKSWDEDGIVERWEWSIVAPNGATTIQTSQNPLITNAQVGTYKVTLNVWDNTSPTRLKSINAAYKEIIVSPAPPNKPPVPNFVWEPFKPFLGETLKLDPDSSYDLDGTIVSYAWSIRSKEGVITNTSTRYPSIVASSEYYDATLTVRDDKGASANITQRVNVNIAKLVPFVTHTDEWKQYWIEEGQDPDTPDFLAGEKFVIRLTTTPANKVEGNVNFGGTVGEVTIPSTEFTLVSTSQFEYVWEAVIWRDDFEYIDEGQYAFNFTGYHPVTNPTVQSDGVYIINIVGNIYDALQYRQSF